MENPCNVCRQIFSQKRHPSEQPFVVQYAEKEPVFAHHEDIYLLVEAASRGCGLCKVLLKQLTPQERGIVGLDCAQPVSISGINTRISYPRFTSISWNWAFELDFQFPVRTLLPVQSDIPPVQKRLYFFRTPDTRSMSWRYGDQDEEHGSPFIKWHSEIESSHRSTQESRVANNLAPSAPNPHPSTGSVGSLDVAKAWVEKCVQSHSSCKTGLISDQRKLPTRLLWINPLKPDTLELCYAQEMSSGTQYTTLSHCWGTTGSRVSTIVKDNGGRVRFPVVSLSKSFQDAVTITKYLGIEYLWIDTLCIIQDSKEDVAKELLLMRDVYSNSYCNIAATHAVNGQGGCFVNRGVEAYQNVAVDFNMNTPRIKGQYFDPGTYELHNPELWENEITKSPLMERGWIFQERILAPRVLHFGASQIFFECQQFRACELHPDGMERLRKMTDHWDLLDDFKSDMQYVLAQAKCSHSPRRFPEQNVAKIAWMYMITKFSATKLSYESDRLVAIAGLAKLIQPLINVRYLAGFWDFDLVSQLMWRSLEVSRRIDTYQAPSWSWASRPGRMNLKDKGMEDVAGKRRLGHDASESTFDLVQILSAEVTTEDGDPMSKVTSGYIRLRGHLEPADENLQYDPDFSDDGATGKLFLVPCIHTELYTMNVYEVYVSILVLRATGRRNGEFRRVGIIQYDSSGRWSAFSRANWQKSNVHEDFYESYDNETGDYCFKIV